MMISTKGRYALRVLVDMTRHEGEGFVSLSTLSKRADVSLKYLELIVSALTKGGLLLSKRGKEGGYKLSRDASEISLGAILRLTEGSLAPVECMTKVKNCKRAGDCPTLPLWHRLDTIIETYLNGLSLRDLSNGNVEGVQFVDENITPCVVNDSASGI